MKILVVANSAWNLLHFRKPLLIALQEAGYEVVLIAPRSAYSQSLSHLGFRFIHWGVNRKGRNFLAETLSFLRLLRIYWNERPHAIHHFTIKPVIYGSLAARILDAIGKGQIRTINTVTGLGHVFLASGITHKLIKLLVTALYRVSLAGKRTTVIFQNTDDQEFFLKRQIVEESRTQIIRGSGVNTNDFRPDRTSQLGKHSSFQVIYAGRLIREKGILELFEAMLICKDRNLKIDFRVLGEIDPQNPSSLTMNEVLKWQKILGFAWAGQVSNISRPLQESDLAVLPSYREGVPRFLLEAAASGLPIVATNVPGCRDVVKNQITGLLVPARDSRALAEAIEQMYHKRETGHKMGIAGRNHVLEHFDERIIVDSTMELYPLSSHSRTDNPPAPERSEGSVT